jgi:hypothetical protein
MYWVQEQWKPTQRRSTKVYATGRSAFWRVAKRVSLEWGLPQDKWWSHICWNNLYRLSPHKGNPPEWSMKLQRETVSGFLGREIKVLKPRLVVAMTGWDWFKPVADEMGVLRRLRHPKAGYVEAVADVYGARIVICKHPMCKPEDDLFAEMWPHCSRAL